ncbi:alkaline phosphatase family protein [Nocardioides sp. R-C-SC26]|uniref:alkaline phosphatase family protein n=1 Tax=Nocardioides sp. R-C-SC26 TaxID=2870414 RepID=UPI001E2F71A1|nr:alkaline phosphatase family protein [Nocardioides sp. R-C-SC26]
MTRSTLARLTAPSTRSRHGGLAVLALAMAALVPVASGCSSPAATDATRAELVATGQNSSAASSGASAGVDSGGAVSTDDDVQVLAISVDALTPVALRRLGRDGAPNLWRIVDEGAATLNARSQVELTLTLPNHTSMVTGRRIDARAETNGSTGHGVTWNTDRPGTTVQRAAGRPVGSVFSRVEAAGLSTALFAAKTKFSLFQRSWPAIDRVTIREERDGAVMSAARADLLRADRAFTFVHLGNADATGHRAGFGSSAYLDAVRTIDRQIGTVLDAADSDPRLADLVVVLTADHGGVAGATSHSDRRDRANFTVPFAVWAPSSNAALGRGDLYALNPARRDPGAAQPGYAARRPPIRNGDVANLALDLLGLTPIPGSLYRGLSVS